MIIFWPELMIAWVGIGDVFPVTPSLFMLTRLGVWLGPTGEGTLAGMNATFLS